MTEANMLIMTLAKLVGPKIYLQTLAKALNQAGLSDDDRKDLIHLCLDLNNVEVFMSEKKKQSLPPFEEIVTDQHVKSRGMAYGDAFIVIEGTRQFAMRRPHMAGFVEIVGFDVLFRDIDGNSIPYKDAITDEDRAATDWMLVIKK